MVKKEKNNLYRRIKCSLKKVALASVATLITAGACYFLTPENVRPNLSQPFSRNPFMMGYDSRIFERDKELGFRFPEGRLISSNNFANLEEVVSSIEEKDSVFLNMGDSSTSGWNSDMVFKGQKDPNAAFFTYQTYSDMLGRQTNCVAINAGVPGYTSYQGKKYLKRILEKTSSMGISIDYVTLYFGNNDCTYNEVEDKVQLDKEKPSKTNTKGYRVTLQDYQKNMSDMIQLCRDYGAKPIIIVPPRHYDWSPGVRSTLHKDEFCLALKSLRNRDTKKDLLISLDEYKKGNYKSATQYDRVLPRIKEEYVSGLKKIAEDTKTEFVDVQEIIPLTNNSRYFSDYCHPIEKTNQYIVDGINKIAQR